MSDYELCVVKTTADWARYHEIRRQELFEERGRDFYDENHPDETVEGNTPLLLKCEGVGLATARIDMKSDSIAIVRLVAVDSASQGQGLGRILAEQFIAFSKEHGAKKILVNAAPTAIGYYAKLGFVEDPWDPSELVGISATSTQMSLTL